MKKGDYEILFVFRRLNKITLYRGEISALLLRIFQCTMMRKKRGHFLEL